MDIKEVSTAIITAIAVGGVVLAIMKLKFVTKEECKSEQSICSTAVCKKIDTLASNFDERMQGFSDTLKALKKTREEELKAMHEFIGTVKQYMKDH